MLKSELARIKEPVETRLKDFFDEASARSFDGLFGTRPDSNLLDEVRELTLRGGKRVRAALLIQGASLFNPKAAESEAVVDAAAALEIFHAYLLIHDDIMDQDDLRRGGKSVHAALIEKTGSRQEGVGLGILAGDLAAALSGILLSRLEVAADRKVRLQRIFADTHLDVVHGQVLDVSGSAAALEVATHKTASYTTIGPLAMGAVLGGADDEQVERLADLARPLGVAFQFADDVLGTFGKSEDTGKSTDRDLKAGKRTVLIDQDEWRVNPEHKSAVEAVLGREDATTEEIEAAKKALRDSGALDGAVQRVSELIAEFKTGVENEGYAKDATRFLLDLADYIGARNQ